jgi:predicted alpha/beta hydrolase
MPHCAVSDFLKSSHTCLLLMSIEIRRLEEEANGLLKTYGWPRLSVGQELGAALLAVAPRHRPRAADQWPRTCLRGMVPGPVLCTETDLLFEPALKLDPLRLMRDVSKVTRLVVAWPGSYADDVLAYAAPEHSHYRTWRRPEVSIVVLE